MNFLSKFVIFKKCIITDFNNTIYFENDNIRDNYFNSNFEKIEFEKDFNYIRDSSTLRISYNFYEIQNCNYGYFIENTIGRKIYFRIVSVEYVNDKVTEISIAIDILMTYNSGNKLLEKAHNSTILRKHISKNSSEELLQSLRVCGDVLNFTKTWHVSTKTHFFTDFVIVFTSSVDLSSKWGDSDSPLVPVSSGGTYDGITSPQTVYQTSEEHFTDLMKKLKDYPWIAQNITSVIKCPTEIFNSEDMTPIKLNDGQDQIVNKFKNGKFSDNFVLPDLKFSKNEILKLYGIEKEKSYLLRSPYFYIEATNWQGSSITINFEELNWNLQDDDKEFLSFNCQTLLGYDNKVMIYPINYNSNDDNSSYGVGQGAYLKNCIEFSNFDSVPVLIDNAKNSWAKSSYTRNLENSRQITSRARNVVNGGIDIYKNGTTSNLGDKLTDMYSLAQNYGSVNPLKLATNIAGGLKDEHQYYQDQQARYNENNLQSPTVTPQTNNNTFQIANELFGLTLKFKAINDVDYKAVEQYHNRFGFAYPLMETIEKPNNMTILDYLKVNITQLSHPQLSIEMIEIVKTLLANGVNFWHDNGVGNEIFNQDIDKNVRR